MGHCARAISEMGNTRHTFAGVSCGGLALAPSSTPMTSHRTSSRRFRLILGSLAALMALTGRAAHAQDQPLLLPLSSKLESVKLEAPTLEAPKFEAPKHKIFIPRNTKERSPFALDRPVLALGLLQGSAELFDGVATHRYVNAPTCRSCREVDPVCRTFLGPKPTWPRMLALGAIEDLGATFLHQHLRRSPHKFVRWLAPAAPLALTAIHLEQGLGVLNATTHPCSALGSRYASVGDIGGHEACQLANPSAPAAPLQLSPQSKSPPPRLH